MLLNGWSLELPQGIEKPKVEGRNIYDESPKGTKKTRKRRWRRRKNDILKDLIVDHLQEGIATIGKAIK
jgi:hypothetical protein